MFLGSLETVRFTGVLWGGSYRPGSKDLVFHKLGFIFYSYSKHHLPPKSSHQSSEHRFILHWEYFRILYNIEQERQMLHLNLYSDVRHNASDEPGYSWFVGCAPCFILPKGFSSFSLLPCFSIPLAHHGVLTLLCHLSSLITLPLFLHRLFLTSCLQ